MFTALVCSCGLDRIRKIEKKIQKLFCLFIQIFLCIVILLTMIYQLEFTSNNIFMTNCTFSPNESANVDPLLLKPNDNLAHIGFFKTKDIGYALSVSVDFFLFLWWIWKYTSCLFIEISKNYIVIMMLLILQKVVHLKSDFYSIVYKLNQQPKYNIIFANISVKHIDLNIRSYLKYLINFCFFKFGLEVMWFSGP